ncbi:MAG: TetR/AcrR family transcriptional regulator [Candidatus Aminicenantes bacterium]|nr:TetR/AcrR family transcriptional regulator [Candidatus Aminicenantes bacterium]
MKKKDFRAERKQHRIEENKIFILKAAEKIFAQKGFSLATMDDIAEEAQFSKATLYRYYKSKSEIFFEIIYKSFEEVLQKTKKIKKEEISAEKKLRELIYYVSSYYHKKKNISRIFIMEKSAVRKILNLNSKEQFLPLSKHPPIPAIFKAKMEEIFNIMCEIIKEGIKSGEFRNVDIRNAGFILGAMIRGFHFRGPMQDAEFSLEESTELLHSFFLYGIKKDRKA